MGQILAQHDLGNTHTTTRATYHNGVVMGAPKPEHHPEVVLKPALRKQHLLLIPNPADVVLQVGVLSDIIEAGRHGHVNHRTSLAGIVQKRRRTNHLTKINSTVLAIQPDSLRNQNAFCKWKYLEKPVRN